ncbi:ferritin family protein [Myxococcota bacterium]
MEFAIAGEQEAVDFYSELAEKTTNAHARANFKQFAEEERGHKRKLLAVQKGGIELKPGKKVLDLKMADYLVDVEPTKDLDYQYVLILAMKREKAAFRLYTDLAEQVNEEEIRSLFLALAQEEAKHKLRFEIEYDDEIYAQN